MAITKIVDLQVNSNIDQTTQDVKQLNTAIQSVDKSADKVGTSLNKAGAAGNSFGAIKNMVTELNPALAGAEKGFGAVLTQMWAMVANPIGAVIAALVLGLTALYKAFTSTDEGADKLEQMMSGLSNVMVVIRDRFLKFGEALAKFFSGDFSGAVKDAKSAISGVGDEIAAEFKKGAEAARLLQEVADAMRDLKVARAELNKNLAESKELLSDENATYAQKKKAIEEIRKGEAEYTKDALENARKTLRAAQLNKKASADERLDAIADAKAEILNLEAESAQILRSANKQQKQLNAQMEADQKEAHDKRTARNKEISDARNKEIEQIKALKKAQLENVVALENEITKVLSDAQDKQAEFLVTKEQAQITAVNDKYFRLIELAKQQGRTQEEIDTLEIAQMNEVNDIKLQGQDKYYADKKAKTDKDAKDEIDTAKAVADAKLAIQNAGLDNISKGINLLQTLGIKNKAIQKALLVAESAAGIAKIIVNTNAANSAARLKYSLLPGGAALAAAEIVMNKVGAGIGIAANLAATAKALGALGGGGAPSAGGASGGDSGGGSATPNFNVVGNSGVNQLAGIMATKDQTPVKAYVVPSDVTTGQSLDRNIIRNASLG
jgi:hypothetical protein